MSASAVTVAVPTETVPGERRVALVPEVAGRLVKQGLTVRVQAGAGEAAGFADAAYAAAGCAIAPSAAAAMQDAGLIVKIQCPTMDEAAAIPADALLLSPLQPTRDADVLRALLSRKVRVMSMTLVPRITRAQGMDMLSSQATVAGYRAVLVGVTLGQARRSGVAPACVDLRSRISKTTERNE